MQNVVAQVPYANVRVLALAGGARPDDSQLRRMRYEVRRGMDEGATGVSTGMDYISQCFAETDELVEVIAASAADRACSSRTFATSAARWPACAKRSRSAAARAWRAYLAPQGNHPARSG